MFPHQKGTGEDLLAKRTRLSSYNLFAAPAGPAAPGLSFAYLGVAGGIGLTGWRSRGFPRAGAQQGPGPWESSGRSAGLRARAARGGGPLSGASLITRCLPGLSATRASVHLTFFRYLEILTITELINFRYVIMNNYNAWEKLQRQFKTMALRPHDYAEVLLKTLSLNVLSCRSGGNGGRKEGRLGTPC